MTERQRVRRTKSGGQDPIFVFMQVRDAETSEEGHAVDPVCRSELKAGFAAGRLIHRGVEYRFCSLSCARAFAAHPEEFVR